MLPYWMFCLFPCDDTFMLGYSDIEFVPCFSHIDEGRTFPALQRVDHILRLACQFCIDLPCLTSLKVLVSSSVLTQVACHAETSTIPETWRFPGGFYALRQFSPDQVVFQVFTPPVSNNRWLIKQSLQLLALFSHDRPVF